MSDTFSIRNKIAIDICDTYFGGNRSLKGKIIQDMSQLKLDYLLKLQEVLESQQEYTLNAVSKKQKANGFNKPYGKFKYLYQIAGRLIKDAKCKSAEPKQPPKEPPAPQPKAAEQPSCMDELTADNQSPKQASTEDEPAISDSDLFEAGPDAIHEARASMDESERRKNWNKAIAKHKQQHPPKVFSYDEMY